MAALSLIVSTREASARRLAEARGAGGYSPDLDAVSICTPSGLHANQAVAALEVEDTAVAVVRFASGALGAIHGTTAAYPGLEASVRVFGTKGSAVIADETWSISTATPGRRQSCPCRHRRPTPTRSRTPTR